MMMPKGQGTRGTKDVVLAYDDYAMGSMITRDVTLAYDDYAKGTWDGTPA